MDAVAGSGQVDFAFPPGTVIADDTNDRILYAHSPDDLRTIASQDYGLSHEELQKIYGDRSITGRWWRIAIAASVLAIALSLVYRHYKQRKASKK
jgi:hypothetical protein